MRVLQIQSLFTLRLHFGFEIVQLLEEFVFFSQIVELLISITVIGEQTPRVAAFLYVVHPVSEYHVLIANSRTHVGTDKPPFAGRNSNFRLVSQFSSIDSKRSLDRVIDSQFHRNPSKFFEYFQFSEVGGRNGDIQRRDC